MERTGLIVAGSGLLSILLGIGMAILTTRAIARPITSMTDAMRMLAAGNNDAVVPALGQTDEIGKMAAADEIFKQAAIEKLRVESEAAEHRRAGESDRAAPNP